MVNSISADNGSNLPYPPTEEKKVNGAVNRRCKELEMKGVRTVPNQRECEGNVVARWYR